MVFSSNVFLFAFLPMTLLLHTIAPRKIKNLILLALSLVFYAWGEPRVVFIMIGCIIFNYLFGLVMDAGRQKQWPLTIRRLVLVVTVVGNLGMLFYYKYFDFFLSNVNLLFGTNVPLRHIALPIGISFFTFQIMSYVLDLYMGKVKVQKNPLDLALYIALFPQLIAGPIVRYIDVNAQIRDRRVTRDKFAEGIRRFAVGLVKKMYLANTMALVADQIYAQPYTAVSQATAWLGAICYAFQIYFDFSGYSDMAIGMGKMLGFDFLENFNYPYISRSMTEFWRRWHISLSSWFRDYVYIPLGGNRRGNRYVNLSVVFLLTGLWHGASWNFVFWGVWNGFFLLLEKPLMKKEFYQKIPAPVQRIVTMLIVLIGWVFFRVESFSEALGFLGVMFGAVRPVDLAYTAPWFLTRRLVFVLVCAVIASMPVAKLIGKRVEGRTIGRVGSNVVCAGLMIFGAMLCMISTYNPFIYFRF